MFFVAESRTTKGISKKVAKLTCQVFSQDKHSTPQIGMRVMEFSFSKED